MSNNRSTPKARASVYANVLFDACKSHASKEAAVQARNQLLDVINLLAENVDARAVLSSSDADVNDKLKLASVLTQGASVEVKTIVNSIVENGDIQIIKLIFNELERLISDDLKVCVVDVTTSVELNDALRAQIRDKAKNELGMDAILNEKIDSSILGGIIMSVNGKCIDASMITQLNRARAVLKAS